MLPTALPLPQRERWTNQSRAYVEVMSMNVPSRQTVSPLHRQRSLGNGEECVGACTNMPGSNLKVPESRVLLTVSADSGSLALRNEKLSRWTGSVIVTALVSNWRSFRDPVTFSMVASRERQHSFRVSRVKRIHARLLPIAAIFGGNASGKTNFFRAINFAKTLIVRGTRRPGARIPVEPFRLDDESGTKPSRFEFRLLIDEILYNYRFSVTSERVLMESLARTKATKEVQLYKRTHDTIDLHPTLGNDSVLQFAFQSTRPNQLFLTSSVLLNIDTFLPVYQWFSDQLELVAPDSRFAPFASLAKNTSKMNAKITDAISQLDVGIARIDIEEISLDRILPKALIEDMTEDLKDDQHAVLKLGKHSGEYIVVRKNGELVGKQLVTIHRKTNGNEVKFELRDESDGSRRVLDLLPGFVDLSGSRSQSVYMIDEIDRSLHTVLTRSLLESYLRQCSHETRSQLVFTTHDAQLIDQSLLRRDEIWVTETDKEYVSHLFSFGDYDGIRHDKDIRKSYLQGRLGGIPRIFS